MEQLGTHRGRPVWLDWGPVEAGFRSPVAGEFALLLVDPSSQVEPAAEAGLAEELVARGCRYAVCWGPQSSSWDDAIDWVGVDAELEGRLAPFVMTTWHGQEPLEETVEFLLETARFDSWEPPAFLVRVLGSEPALVDAVREPLLRSLDRSPWGGLRLRRLLRPWPWLWLWQGPLQWQGPLRWPRRWLQALLRGTARTGRR